MTECESIQFAMHVVETIDALADYDGASDIGKTLLAVYARLWEMAFEARCDSVLGSWGDGL